jgi:OmpA-OmpF porin, OOP family
MKNIKTFAPSLLWLAMVVANAQTAQLTPAPKRITDSAIQTDMATYEATQKRIKALNDKGRPVRDYHLAKAQCWLDVSFHEYTRNDRSAFPQEALTESEKLIRGMEAGTSPLPMDTPLVNRADRLRDDLWAQSEALKRHAGFSCAAAKIACAEVELVHAGNEHKQQQWRHAKPYVQIAEELMTEGQRMAEACQPPAPPPVVRLPAVAAEAAPAPAPMPAPVPAAPPPPAPRALVLFNFDKHTPGEIRPYSMEELDALVARMRQEPQLVQGITLVGHADRLNSTGKVDYNIRLAEKRVQTVRKLLIERGVAADMIRTDSKGDSLQVLACSTYKVEAQVRECLLPNRRVEVRLDLKPR